MTVFKSYLDVSRDEGDSNVYMLAGFMSDVEGWATFEVEWQTALNDFGIPAFHMTDFDSCWGVFKGWTPDDPRRVPLLTTLLGIIERNTVASVGYGVSQLMYERVVPQKVDEAVGGAPYFFAFLNLVLATEALMDDLAKSQPSLAGLQTIHVPSDWKMLYILARGDKGAQTVVNTWMSDVEGARSSRIDSRVEGVYIPTDNAKHPMLQAADILAFEGRKQVALHLGQHGRPQRRSFTALDASHRPRAWHFYLTDSHLKQNAEAIWQGIQDSLKARRDD